MRMAASNSHVGAMWGLCRYGNSVVIDFENMNYENLASVTNSYRGTFPCFSDDTQVLPPFSFAFGARVCVRVCDRSSHHCSGAGSRHRVRTSQIHIDPIYRDPIYVKGKKRCKPIYIETLYI